MARKASTLTTAEQLDLEGKKLEKLIAQKTEIEEQIKATKTRIAELEQISTREKLTDICSLANERGISVDDLLRAVQEGTILDMIATSSNTEKEPTVEASAAVASNSTPNTNVFGTSQSAVNSTASTQSNT